MAIDTQQASMPDELARALIRGLLAGVKPKIDPADCGQWADRVQELVDAYDVGGQARVFWVYNMMSADLDLAVLLATDPGGNGSHGNPAPAPGAPKALPVQFFLDQGANDEGNAQCLNLLYGKEFIYTEALGYLWWTGRHWSTQGAEASLKRATIHTLKQRAMLATRADRKDLAPAASPSSKHIRDCIYQFQPHITTPIEDFDCSPGELNCANGVLDLATGQLVAHDPGQRFTYCLPVEYDPNADQTLWRQFLTDVVGGGPEVVDYLQMAVGYSLTGYTREECLFYIHGPTRSGKGTFTETLLTLLPKPLAVEVDFTTFTADRGGDTQNFDLAPLKPARMIVASESNKYQALNTGKIKSLTGGNEVYCAFKRRDHFSYRPQYKIWLVSNHPVNADVDDDAAWYRLKVIEFPNSFADKEDTSLKLRMREPENLKGVLAWAAEGAIKWFALGPYGLGPHTPAAVITATKQHRADLDFIQVWLDECCEISPAHWTASEEVYRSYRNWSTDNGVEAKKIRMFMLALKGKGFLVGVQKKVAGAMGQAVVRRGVVGLRLI